MLKIRGPGEVWPTPKSINTQRFPDYMIKSKGILAVFRSASSSITRPGQIQKNHEKVSEVMEISLRTIYDQLWLVMNCYDQLWAFMTSYELLWLVMNCYDKLWTVMTSYDHGQLWLVIGQLEPVLWTVVTSYDYC